MSADSHIRPSKSGQSAKHRIEPLPLGPRKVGTLRELAGRYACSLRTVKGWIYDEGCPHFFTGSKVLVNFEEVDQWFEDTFRRIICPAAVARKPSAESKIGMSPNEQANN